MSGAAKDRLSARLPADDEVDEDLTCCVCIRAAFGGLCDLCCACPKLISGHAAAGVLCCYQCRPLTALLIMLPLISAIAGLGAGTGIGIGIIFPTGYYNNYGWHEAQDQAFPFAAAFSALAALLVWRHPRPIYLIRVQRAPPLRIAIGCCYRRRRSPSHRVCECLPLLTFCVAASLSLWTVLLYTVAPFVGLVPPCIAMLIYGSTSRFSRTRCIRCVRIVCGRPTYDALDYMSPFSSTGTSRTAQQGEEHADLVGNGTEGPGSSDDEDWLATSGSNTDTDTDSDSDGDLGVMERSGRRSYELGSGRSGRARIRHKGSRVV